MNGLNKIDEIYFKRDSKNSEDKNVEYFLRPDVIIAENGIGQPRYDLQKLLLPGDHAEHGEPPIQVGIDSSGIPGADIRFSLHYNDLFSPIVAAGSACTFNSFIHKTKIRTTDIKYNIEAGFFAAMAMLDKRIEFKYFPMTSLKIGNTPIYYVGERGTPFHEIIINGSVEDRKFVAYFIYGNEITAFMTCGYQNLHLYLWEALKLLIMPPATQLRNKTMDYKHIVNTVLKLRPQIQCKRHEIVKLPSVMLSEFDNELEKAEELRGNVRRNILKENQRQKQKFQEMKQKYDREGVEYIQDELELADRKQREGESYDPVRARQMLGDKAHTLKGARKPGETTSGSDLYNRPSKRGDVNMGTDNENQKNPLSMIINAAKSTFNGGGK